MDKLDIEEKLAADSPWTTAKNKIAGTISAAWERVTGTSAPQASAAPEKKPPTSAEIEAQQIALIESYRSRFPEGRIKEEMGGYLTMGNLRFILREDNKGQLHDIRMKLLDNQESGIIPGNTLFTLNRFTALERDRLRALEREGIKPSLGSEAQVAAPNKGQLAAGHFGPAATASVPVIPATMAGIDAAQQSLLAGYLDKIAPNIKSRITIPLTVESLRSAYQDPAQWAELRARIPLYTGDETVGIPAYIPKDSLVTFDQFEALEKGRRALLTPGKNGAPQNAAAQTVVSAPSSTVNNTTLAGASPGQQTASADSHQGAYWGFGSGSFATPPSTGVASPQQEKPAETAAAAMAKYSSFKNSL